ncbi:MAG: hypothetical protein HY262_06555 [Chloroflexi bacterium]|nr:hypothetical protein [Chloroflexota bacterium]
MAERIDGVVAWGSGLVAYGRVRLPGRNQFNDQAAVFLSDTGDSWRTVPIDAGVGPADTSEIHLLAAGPHGIVLFGDTCCEVEAPATWWSADGESWERVPFPSTSPDGPQLAAATATADGFLVVGSEADRAGIWRSSDGRAWTAVNDAAARLSSGAVADVAFVNGRWLAAGTQDVGGRYVAAFWESRDGTVWRPVPAKAGFPPDLDVALGRLHVTSEGVLLIGNEGSHDERVQCERSGLDCGWGVETHWWSIDGRTWEQLPPVFPKPGQPAFEGPDPGEFRLLTVGPTGLIDLGEDRSGEVRLWVSADGRKWRDRGSMGIRLHTDLPSGVALTGGRVVAVGDAWDGGNQPGEPAVWIGSGL